MAAKRAGSAIRRRPTDRASFQADRPASRRVRSDRRRGVLGAAAGSRSGADGRCHRRRRAFLCRRSGRRDRAQGAAGEPLRSRRQGRQAGWLPALAGAAGRASANAGSTRSRAGSAADAKRYGCPLLGGDTVRTPGPLMVSVAAFGTLPTGTMVRRTRRAVGRPCVRHRHHRRCRARALKLRRERQAAKRWKLVADGARHLARALSGARAAQRDGDGGAHIRHGGDGRVGRACGRSWQALPRLRRGSARSTSRACRCRRRRGRRLRPSRQADRDRSCPAATTTKSSAPSRTRSRCIPGGGAAAGVPVTDIGRIVEGAGRRFPPRRTASRSASNAPLSAIFDVAGRAILAADKVEGNPCTTSRPRARPCRDRRRSPNFLKHQRWYPTIYDLAPRRAAPAAAFRLRIRRWRRG